MTRLCRVHCRRCGARWAAADPVASWLRHCTFQRAEWVGTLPMWAIFLEAWDMALADPGGPDEWTRYEEEGR